MTGHATGSNPPAGRRQDRARATRLSLPALAAMAVAYLLIWIVFSDPDVADTLMNGTPPPGTAVVGNRFAVVAGVLAALGSWIAAVASRRVIPVLLVIVATMPFAPVTLFTAAIVFQS